VDEDCLAVMEVAEVTLGSTLLAGALAPLGADVCFEIDLCRPDSRSFRLDGAGLSTSKSVAYPDCNIPFVGAAVDASRFASYS